MKRPLTDFSSRELKERRICHGKRRAISQVSAVMWTAERRTKMVVCKHCNQEMLEANSCIKRMSRQIPFGEETIHGWIKEGWNFVCGDCGILVGGFHHTNCDIEECPYCHGQRLSCSCGRKGMIGLLDTGPRIGEYDGAVIAVSGMLLRTTAAIEYRQHRCPEWYDANKDEIENVKSVMDNFRQKLSNDSGNKKT
jgi:hypothetical protein